MSRVRLQILLSAVGLTVCLGGCQSTGSNPLAHWPWINATPQKDEYKVPPMEDNRYTDAQTYPKETMQATLRGESGSGGSGSSGPNRGLVGPMRQTASGRY
jgi:hypothetical protein